MVAFRFSCALVGFLFFLSFFSFRSEADPNYLFHVCSNRTNFTKNSTFQANLNSLLSALSTNVTYDTGFGNSTAGQRPDAVYGLFLCRGDFSVDTCKDCVTFATQDIFQYCDVQKEAIVWYDQCLLRYSYRSIFSNEDEGAFVAMLNTQDIAGPQDRFNQLVLSLMNDVADEAANASVGAKKFAIKMANFTASQSVYGLAQCTPDLNRQQCSSCLGQAINKLPGCCSGKQGGRVLYPSCNVRYEIYPFYNGSLTAVPSPAPVLRPPSASGPVTPPKGKSNWITIVAIVAPIAVSIVLFVMGCCFLVRRARKKYDSIQEDNAGNEISTAESLQFDFATIEAATNKFSDSNKLGEGGFGEVYKGRLPNGQVIAVKRLSRSSGQGAEEFKNEVVVVAKLQHRNLVRLQGFCLEGEEKILVYEFVPNKSLDYFLYDPEKQGQLDWSRRYKIIGGIARGILYLHEDSRLRIIHRDLKASNILLDSDMNPKISDFGMARIFGVDQTQANTGRIVGTYGYMSPEYAMHGQFSMKSDIYSFGVLVLEIISGKKNSSFYQADGAADLLSYTWKLWRDGTPLELLDSKLGDTYSRNEVIRCIHIGLLCVQEDPTDRPTMATIVLMLNSYSVTLPLPQQPAFFIRSRADSDMPLNIMDSYQSTSKSMPSQPWSVNDVSITEVYPR